jgi:hypothetical protein
LDWYTPFTKALECPTALALYLADDLGLGVRSRELNNIEKIFDSDGKNSAVASVAVWLTTPNALTELVGISGFQQLPGSPASAQFDAYAVIDPNGMDGSNTAIDWMRQMCDYSLHLDGYDAKLMGYGELMRMIGQA